MQIAEIVSRLQSIEVEFGDGSRDFRGMSCLGASNEDIARSEGRIDGREEVVSAIHDLLRDMGVE